MSEVPLYTTRMTPPTPTPSMISKGVQPRILHNRAPAPQEPHRVQGYLAHKKKKTPP